MSATGESTVTASPLQTILRRVGVLTDALEDVYRKLEAVTYLLADDGTDPEAPLAHFLVLADDSVSRSLRDMAAKARARGPGALDAWLRARDEENRAQPWIPPRGTRGAAQNEGASRS